MACTLRRPAYKLQLARIERDVETQMQHAPDQTYFESADRRHLLRTSRAHRRRTQERSIRIHQKIVAGLALLVLLIAYDIAMRIDEHVTYVTASHASPLAFDDSAAATHRF